MLGGRNGVIFLIDVGIHFVHHNLRVNVRVMPGCLVTAEDNEKAS
jgi:hypothetical protein